MLGYDAHWDKRIKWQNFYSRDEIDASLDTLSEQGKTLSLYHAVSKEKTTLFMTSKTKLVSQWSSIKVFSTMQ